MARKNASAKRAGTQTHYVSRYNARVVENFRARQFEVRSSGEVVTSSKIIRTTAQSLPPPTPMELFEDFPPIHALDDQVFGPVDRERLDLPALGNMFSLDQAYLAHLADMDTDDVAVSRARKPSDQPLFTFLAVRETYLSELHGAKNALIRAFTAFNALLSCIGARHYTASNVHSVSLDYCGCETAKLPIIQLLRHRLFPATSVAPRSAATFAALDHFHMLSLEGKLSAFEFWRALARTTDKTEIEPPPDRYEPFMRMMREWRHLHFLKRGGRMSDPEGPAGTAQGELALKCPACPHPEINLPPDWEKAPPQTSDRADPGLGRGWSYFVEEGSYQDYLKTCKEPVQKSTCNAHKAVNDADKRDVKGLAVSGLGTIECIRHDFKRAHSSGDLKKGERYSVMDYLFFSSIANIPHKRLVVSYDIACQWGLHLWSRMADMPERLRLAPSSEREVTFLVPKFHLPAHITACQASFSFNYTRGVGRTDGEAPERGWDFLNPAAGQTKEMGPGARRELLEDLMGDRNWKKTVGIGKTLLRRMKTAVPTCREQIDSHHDFEKRLGRRIVEPWRRDVEKWEADPAADNPFSAVVNTVSQNSVRLELNRQEGLLLAKGELELFHEHVTPCVLISMGLDLEDQQRSLAHDTANLGLHATDRQRLMLVQKANIVRNKVNVWIDHQKLYCPSASALRAGESNLPTDPIAAVPMLNLWLPSSIGSRATCPKSLQEIEWQLRHAQAHDALHDIRANLQIRVGVFQQKDRFERGQRAMTRSRSVLARLQDKIDECTERYRVARRALVSLAPILGKGPQDWSNAIRELRDADIRPISAGEMRETEGRRTISWIWLVDGVAATAEQSEVINDSVRLEWCKSRARAMRWSEEVDLLKEEMRRVLQFMEWQASEWEKRAESTESTGSAAGDIQRGAAAYAKRQASIRRSLTAEFRRMWSSVPTLLSFHDPYTTFSAWNVAGESSVPVASATTSATTDATHHDQSAPTDATTLALTDTTTHHDQSAPADDIATDRCDDTSPDRRNDLP
ncbi:hypothetical protein PC9H_008829 [Pleurotus ostreatus]|uniref:CxC2-like cysteine cluster KDZ transposase-associated domain-containing protein n=1 Tax=Pleurotus ostreatus TaxID=5322 RepID=A0A8H6ZWJ4_PLEOS|nr:uncharacterized protein PC9H_008829 [Pleurotus ostreatus]KAF7426460.1 hypothetical protein PC9H_008829 [Pleurotus ostreatus]